MAALNYHIVAGREASNTLASALLSMQEAEGEVVYLEDFLNLGSLYKKEGQSFQQMREQWWNSLLPFEKEPLLIGDVEKILAVFNALNQAPSATVWIWIAPSDRDLAMYYWVLVMLKKHLGRISVVNIANLPFLDEDGKVFYPKNLSEVLPKELVKAMRLARLISAAELEMDSEEWAGHCKDSFLIRTSTGGKKLEAKNEEHFDDALWSYANRQYQKATRLIGQAISKNQLACSHSFLAWRIRKLVELGRLDAKLDLHRPFKEWDVKLAAGNSEATIEKLAD